MNLICCDEPCKYQQDGYCTLDAQASISAVSDTTCPYYIGNSDPTIGSQKLQSPLHKWNEPVSPQSDND